MKEGDRGIFPRVLMLLSLWLSAQGLAAYDLEDFQREARRLLHLQNLSLQNLLAAQSANRRFRPVYHTDKKTLPYGDLSVGAAVLPFHSLPSLASRDSEEGFRVVDLGAIYKANYERLFSVDGRLGFSMAKNIYFTFGMGGLPEMNYKNRKSLNWKVSASLYHRLLRERYLAPGLWLGYGYALSGGESRRAIAFEGESDTGTVSFNGELSSEWNGQVWHAELALEKNFFIVNFYLGLMYALVRGDLRSRLEGELSLAGFSEMVRKEKRWGHGALTRMGFEIITGVLKISFEAGRDWLGESLYGQIGFKLGM